MAASRTAILVVFLLMLASAHSLVHTRMIPGDHFHLVPVSEEIDTQDLTAPPALSGKPEIAAAEHRQIIEVDGSVPSPGVGHP
ncbi:hypothetical protein EJB05_33052, partial [Eragrostis curvula]